MERQSKLLRHHDVTQNLAEYLVAKSAEMQKDGSKSVIAHIEHVTPKPLFLSIKNTSTFTGESEWVVKQKLRRGRYRARKSGRRTLVEYASIIEDAATLPVAKFAPPRVRRPRG